MKPYLVAAPCAIQPTQPVAAQSLETRTSDNYFSSPHNSSGTFEKSSADYYLSGNGNNKEGILGGYKRDTLLGWAVALVVLVWAAAWAASKDCYSVPQQNNTNRHNRSNIRKEETISSKNIEDLLDPEGAPMLCKETAKHYEKAYELNLNDKESVDYVLEQLKEGGYKPKKAESKETKEEGLYSLVNEDYDGNNKIELEGEEVTNPDELNESAEVKTKSTEGELKEDSQEEHTEAKSDSEGE